MIKLLICFGLFICPAPAQAVHVVSQQAHINIETSKVSHVIGPVTQTAADFFEEEYFYTMGLPGDRVVLIDSGGGSVPDGNRMIELLANDQAAGHRVICVILRAAHSMAFNLLSRCDVRLAKPGARSLVHKIEAGGWPDGKRRTAKNLREMADELDEGDEPFRQANAKALGISLDEYDVLADNETWFTAEKLLSMGYLQGLIDLLK